MSKHIYTTHKEWIIQNCFDKFGNQIKSNCGRDYWWQKRDKEFLYEMIKTNTSENFGIRDRIRLFIGEKYTVLCLTCKEELPSLDRNYCSLKCSHNNPLRNNKIKNYNNRNPDKLDARIQKANNTKLEKYGYTGWNIEKTKKTKLEKYGDKNYNNRDKSNQTCLKKYGAKTYATSDQGRKHISGIKKETFEDRFSPEQKEIVNDKEKLENLYKKYKNTYVIAEELGVSQTYILCKMNELGIEIVHNMEISMFEKSVLEFITSIYDGKIIKNDRKILDKKEIDIYLPDIKIAIECDGTYWHSENKGKPNKYHLEKTKTCEKQGIQLFHIFDTEWNNKQEIWKSVLRNAIRKIENFIGARQTQIKEITSKTAHDFCEDHHIQGGSNTSINYGLFYDNEIVSVMTFSKARFSNFDWELQRFCSKINYTIHGAASKLLSHFRKHHKGSIVSYANRRWSKGDLYEKLGFEFLHNSSPNYFYFKGDVLESRNKYQKHKLKNILQKYDENNTEYQNMSNNGYYRIWDSGNKVYKYR